MMMATNWMISLDVGGTHATGIALRLLDEALVPVSCPSRNLRGLERTELVEMIRSIADQIRACGADPQGAAWLVGGAGARPEPDRERWKEAVETAGLVPGEIAVSRDYEANHAAAFAGTDGILSVNGTGSVLFGRRSGMERRRGGWGFLLDTTPSGAEFGRLVLQQILGAIEGDFSGKSILARFKNQFKQMQIDRAAILDWVYADPAAQRRLGEVAPVLTISADDGDQTADALVSASLRRWAADVRALASDLGFGSRISLIGMGGLWSRWASFSDRALRTLEEREPGRFHLREPAFSPSWGPLIRHLCPNGSGLDEETLQRLRRLASH
ncbi:MAG TPA: BadF/BadG/BcrA/BcrD ATPase family protein [Candidatus Ozemobacteraceae bacterium]